MTDVYENKSSDLFADLCACVMRMRGDCEKFSARLRGFFGGNVCVNTGKEAYCAENQCK